MHAAHGAHSGVDYADGSVRKRLPQRLPDPAFARLGDRAAEDEQPQRFPRRGALERRIQVAALAVRIADRGLFRRPRRTGEQENRSQQKQNSSFHRQIS
ncbi:hypothetical protein SDC9_165355 [bioreactor metagenome]|uniref:Uncharacterized protein n=1 Tax=bioreactor metagenome TaxID=1076179 RepID=A0A645FU32_9ZZZZ